MFGGGFCERLVASVKRTLKRIAGRSTLTYDELHAILIENKAIISGRLLTYVYMTKNLTKSHHLIYGLRITSTRTVPVMKLLVPIDP